MKYKKPKIQSMSDRELSNIISSGACSDYSCDYESCPDYTGGALPCIAERCGGLCAVTSLF